MRPIQIYDTTLRDGTQGEGVNFSLLDKLQITKRLDELGFDYVEGGFPLSNEKDAEYFHTCHNDNDVAKSNHVGRAVGTEPFAVHSTQAKFRSTFCIVR